MADCKIRSYNAVRAAMFGKKLTKTQWLILRRCGWWTHNEYQYSGRYNSISHSATLADGANCSRFKLIEYTHPERWDTVIVPMTDEQEDRAFAKAMALSGMLVSWDDVVQMCLDKEPVYGSKAVKYDTVGQLCHIFTGLEIWKPTKGKIWCTLDVGKQIYAGGFGFYHWLKQWVKTTELRPDQLHMMAKHYFKTRNGVIT